MNSLNSSLRLLLPSVSEVLVPAECRPRLTRLASRLPPVHCAGFEVRLDESPQVDFAQRILAFRGEPARLRRHLARSSLVERSAWRRLDAFHNAWERPGSSLQRTISGAWLEFDVEAGSDRDAPVPALFISLVERLGRDTEARLMELLSATTELLLEETGTKQQAELIAACLEACPAAAGATDVGFMLSRGAEALRMVFAPFTADEAPVFLSRIGWPGTADDLEPALDAAGEDFGPLVLAVDLLDAADGTSGPLPRVGLEVFPGGYPDDLTRWSRLLDRLVAAGLCVPEKRDALLSWPGYTDPTEIDEPWPDALIVDSLLARPGRFAVLGRRLDHIKLVCQPGRPPVAKAYFGFGPLWMEPPAEADAATTAASSPAAIAVGRAATVDAAALGSEDRAPSNLVDQCQRAIERATGFLLRCRNEGWWWDFPEVMGGSGEWTTAYVAAALATVPTSIAQSEALAAWRKLEQQRGPTEGWGFNPTLPNDADGTLWGLRLAEAAGESQSPRALAARLVLDAHILDEGAVASYVPEVAARLREVLGGVETRGLCAPHVCVTAAAAGLAGFRERLEVFLIHAQNEDGHWRGYWWFDDEYATALAVEALATPSELDVRRQVRGASRWALRRIGVDGAVVSPYLGAASAFATALAVRILTAAAHTETGPAPSPAALRAVGWLVAHQLDDGSWPPSALMRVPRIDSLDPDERPADTFFVGLDEARIFTTATVVTALTAAVPGGGSYPESGSGASATAL